MTGGETSVTTTLDGELAGEGGDGAAWGEPGMDPVPEAPAGEVPSAGSVDTGVNSEAAGTGSVNTAVPKAQKDLAEILFKERLRSKSTICFGRKVLCRRGQTRFRAGEVISILTPGENTTSIQAALIKRASNCRMSMFIVRPIRHYQRRNSFCKKNRNSPC